MFISQGKYTLPFIWLLAAFIAPLLKTFPLNDFIRYLIMMSFLMILVVVRFFKPSGIVLPFKSYGKFVAWLIILFVMMSLIPLYNGYVFQNLELRLAIKWMILLFTLPVIFGRFKTKPNETIFILVSLVLLTYFIFMPSAYIEPTGYYDYIIARSAELNRYQGIFGNPIVLASYAFVLSTFCIALQNTNSSRLAKMLTAVVVMAAFYIYFLTINRQNLLFLTSNIVQLFIIRCLHKTDKNTLVFSGEKAVISAFLLAFVFVFAIGYVIETNNQFIMKQLGFWKQRFQYVSLQSGRMETIKNGLTLIFDNPILGTGYGMVQVALKSGGLRISSVHNTFLQFMASGGLFFGLMGYFFLFIRLPYDLFLSTKNDKGGLVFVVGYTCIFIQSMFESVLHKEHFFVYLSLWALYAAMNNKFASISHSRV